MDYKGAQRSIFGFRHYSISWSPWWLHDHIHLSIFTDRWWILFYEIYTWFINIYLSSGLCALHPQEILIHVCLCYTHMGVTVFTAVTTITWHTPMPPCLLSHVLFQVQILHLPKWLRYHHSQLLCRMGWEYPALSAMLLLKKSSHMNSLEVQKRDYNGLPFHLHAKSTLVSRSNSISTFSL